MRSQSMWTFAAVLPGLVILGLYVRYNSVSPEQRLIGTWKEVNWQYERISAEGQWKKEALDEKLKREIGRGLIEHRGEVWQFDADKQLMCLTKQNQHNNLQWNLKGRGNVLEVRQGERHIENYMVQEVTDDTLVLHFNFDLQVRGMVKIIFKRIANDAAKV